MNHDQLGAGIPLVEAVGECGGGGGEARVGGRSSTLVRVRVRDRVRVSGGEARVGGRSSALVMTSVLGLGLGLGLGFGLGLGWWA